MDKDGAAAARTEYALVVATGAARKRGCPPWSSAGRQGNGRGAAAVSKSEIVESNDNAFEYSGLAHDA